MTTPEELQTKIIFKTLPRSTATFLVGMVLKKFAPADRSPYYSVVWFLQTTIDETGSLQTVSLLDKTTGLPLSQNRTETDASIQFLDAWKTAYQNNLNSDSVDSLVSDLFSMLEKPEVKAVYSW